MRDGEELVCRAPQVGRVELVHAHDGVAPVLVGEGQPVAAPDEGEEEAPLLGCEATQYVPEELDVTLRLGHARAVLGVLV